MKTKQKPANYRFKTSSKEWELYFPDDDFAIKHAKYHNAECFGLTVDYERVEANEDYGIDYAYNQCKLIEVPIYQKVEISPGFFANKRVGHFNNPATFAAARD